MNYGIYRPTVTYRFRGKDPEFADVGAADGPGLAYFNGLTGHSGAFGC